MQIDVSAITDTDIQNAAAVSDLDDAVRPLQDIAGITDGGWAGMAFSGVSWGYLNYVEREEAIRAWLRIEGHYAT